LEAHQGRKRKKERKFGAKCKDENAQIGPSWHMCCKCKGEVGGSLRHTHIKRWASEKKGNLSGGRCTDCPHLAKDIKFVSIGKKGGRKTASGGGGGKGEYRWGLPGRGKDSWGEGLEREKYYVRKSKGKKVNREYE